MESGTFPKKIIHHILTNCYIIHKDVEFKYRITCSERSLQFFKNFIIISMIGILAILKHISKAFILSF